MRKIAILIAGVAFLASCNTDRTNAALEAQQKTIDELKMEIAKQRVVDSMNNVMTVTAMQKQEEKKPVVVTKVIRSSRPKRTVSTSNNDGYAGYSNTSYPTTSSQPTYQEQAPVTQQQKKGWSAKAKGGVIGGGAGAVAGALIHKRQPVVGAVVGGILGAGAGLGVGAVIDKKQGR